MASLGMKPYEGNAVLELNPALVFPILEMLLAAAVKVYGKDHARDYGNRAEYSRRPAANHPAEPEIRVAQRNQSRLQHRNARDGADPAADPCAERSPGCHQHGGENRRQLRHDEHWDSVYHHQDAAVRSLNQQWSVRKTEVTEDEHSRILRLIKPANLKH